MNLTQSQRSGLESLLASDDGSLFSEPDTQDTPQPQRRKPRTTPKDQLENRIAAVEESVSKFTVALNQKFDDGEDGGDEVRKLKVELQKSKDEVTILKNQIVLMSSVNSFLKQHIDECTRTIPQTPAPDEPQPYEPQP